MRNILVSVFLNIYLCEDCEGLQEAGRNDIERERKRETKQEGRRDRGRINGQKIEKTGRQKGRDVRNKRQACTRLFTPVSACLFFSRMENLAA
jgi:hypothetical protein